MSYYVDMCNTYIYNNLYMYMYNTIIKCVGKVEGSEGEVVNQECWVKSQTLPMLKHDV